MKIFATAAILLLAMTGHARAQEPVAPTEEPSTPTAPPKLPGEMRIGEEPLPEPVPEQPPALKVEPKKKRNIGIAARAHGGLGQRSLFDNSVLGADLTAGFGLHIDNVDLIFNLQMLFGSSEGLPTRQFMFGPTFDFEAFSRVRFGVGLAVGGTTVTRATNDSTLSAFSAGASIYSTVDLWKFEERGAIYLVGELSVASAGPLFEKESRKGVKATSIWGPTIAVGVRF